MKFIILGLLCGFSAAAMTNYFNTKTMGVSVSDIKAAKADCEKSGKECVMLWDFVEVEADYEASE